MPSELAKATLDAHKRAVEEAIAAERERCAKIVRHICGETRHVLLGDTIEAAIRT